MSNSSNAACPAEVTNSCAQRHWAIYWILIVCSVAMVGGRVLTVQNHQAKGDSPFFSANDRSRWCTIRSLGDDGVYEIDDVIADPENKIAWDSIDKVRHVGSDGEFHYYSTKPTLFPTILAWKYKALKLLTGWTLRDDAIFVARAMLIMTNVLPWLVYLWLFSLLIDRIPVRDWTRYYVLAAAGFGTFLSTFVVTINNHLPAALSVMVALYCVTQVWREDKVLDENGQYVDQKYEAGWAMYFLAGLFGAFAVANELPALSFFGLAGLACLIRSPKQTALGFLPGMAIVVVAFFATNYAAHGEWQQPYNHRGDGPVLHTVEGDFSEQLDAGQFPAELRDALSPDSEMAVPRVEHGSWPIVPEGEKRWVVRDANSTKQFAITMQKGESNVQIRQWQNWYDYPGSYWLSINDANKSVVDRGQASQVLYAFHILFGHHGIFSLTPIWLFSFAGMLGLMFNKRLKLRWLGGMSLVLTVVVLTFYIIRPEMERNYGGVTSGLRWLFWLAPLWLVSMMPVVDWLGRSGTGRIVCFLLLAISALSAFYSADNPWVHPWLYEIWELTGLPL